MNHRVLLGVDGVVTSGELMALIDEAGGFEVTDVVLGTADVLPSLDRNPVDVALLHEVLAPLPTVDLLRQVTAEHPAVGVVVAMRNPTVQSVRAVMEAGARAVVAVPATLEELHTRLLTAVTWAESIRRRISGNDAEPAAARPRLVVVAGAKGGVGVTTLAVRLALAAKHVSERRRVCLVDLDLQTGDVPSVLGVLPQRSIADLVDVAQDITARAVEDSLYVHPSGLRVLLAPPEGELGEDVTAAVAQRVLGALRSMFEVVIVDCGAVVTEASALAAELADDVLVVTTPDIPALRGVKRLLRLWTRLEVCKPDDVTLVVNRASRDNEVQPNLVGKIVGTGVARTTIPSRFRQLEPGINSSPPDEPERWTLWTPVVRLGREIGLLPPPRRWFRVPAWLRRAPGTRPVHGSGPEAGSSGEPEHALGERPDTAPSADGARADTTTADPVARGNAPAPGAGAAKAGAKPRKSPRRPSARHRSGTKRTDRPKPTGRSEPKDGSDQGSGPMEALAAIFVICILFLCLVQAGLAGFTAVMAGRSANAGARAHGIGADAEYSARASLPVGWRDEAKVRAEGDRVTVTLEVPLVFGVISEGYRGFEISMTAGTVPEES